MSADFSLSASAPAFFFFFFFTVRARLSRVALLSFFNEAALLPFLNGMFAAPQLSPSTPHCTSKRPELPTCPASPLRPERPGALLDQVSLAVGASPQQ